MRLYNQRRPFEVFQNFPCGCSIELARPTLLPEKFPNSAWISSGACKANLFRSRRSACSEWTSGTNHFTATLASAHKRSSPTAVLTDKAGAVAEFPACKATLPTFRCGKHFLGRHSCGLDQNGFHLALQRSVVPLRLAFSRSTKTSSKSRTRIWGIGASGPAR